MALEGIVAGGAWPNTEHIFEKSWAALLKFGGNLLKWVKGVKAEAPAGPENLRALSLQSKAIDYRRGLCWACSHLFYNQN